VTPCPRCGEGVAVGQEYCLECGLTLPGASRLGAPPADRRRTTISLVVAAVVAIAGASLGIALTRDSATATPIITATGGSQPVPAPAATRATRLVQWPTGKTAWTNVLVSVPKVDGRDAAVARAELALRKGLRQVGILDSSRFASLHTGYWMVWSGVYPSAPEAASRLREARAVQKGARVQLVSS
jgi:hypothetical protein